MDKVTVALGKSLHDFQEKTCSAYDTKELRREAGARRKRQAQAAAMQNQSTATGIVQAPLDSPANTGIINNEVGEQQPNYGTPVESLKPTLEEQQPNPSTPAEPSKPAPARKRKRPARSSKNTSEPSVSAGEIPTSTLSDRLKKSLNLNTYKNHSLGDYTETIRRYGTTDSYSTESVTISHLLDYNLKQLMSLTLE